MLGFVSRIYVIYYTPIFNFQFNFNCGVCTIIWSPCYHISILGLSKFAEQLAVAVVIKISGKNVLKNQSSFL
jgi:hypothetical protein